MSAAAAAELCTCFLFCSVLFCSAAVTQFPPQGSINIISSLSAALHLISATNVQEFVLLTAGDERQRKLIFRNNPRLVSVLIRFFLFNNIIEALRVVLLNESVR